MRKLHERPCEDGGQPTLSERRRDDYSRCGRDRPAANRSRVGLRFRRTAPGLLERPPSTRREHAGLQAEREEAPGGNLGRSAFRGAQAAMTSIAMVCAVHFSTFTL
jgi:hypothetical protein